MDDAVVWHVTMSLDGFITGRDDDMSWAVPYLGENPFAVEVMHRVGAVLAGRRWFEVATEHHRGVDGIYGGAWKGPVLVLSHRAPGEVDPRITWLEGVSLVDAVRRAREAARGKSVVVFGASLPQQCLEEQLLDEIVVHLAPVLLGEGTPLFRRDGGAPIRLERIHQSTAGTVTNLRFRVEGRRHAHRR